MFDPKKISENFEEMSAKFSEMLKNSPAKDIEKNVKAGMSTMFNRLDLVTRQEYEIQLRVVESAQMKICELDARVAALEEKLQPKETKEASNQSN